MTLKRVTFPSTPSTFPWPGFGEVSKQQGGEVVLLLVELTTDGLLGGIL